MTKCPNHELNNVKSKVKSAVAAGNSYLVRFVRFKLMKMTRPSADVKARVIRVIERQAVVLELQRFLVHKDWKVRVLVV